MNVCFANFATDAAWGGGEHWTALTAAGMAERGHAVSLLTRQDSTRFGAGSAAAVLPALRVTVSFDYAPRTIAAIHRILRRDRPDVVVVHHNKDVRTAGVAARLLGIPVVHRNGFPILRDRVRDEFAQQWVTRILTNSQRIRERYAAYGWIDPTRIDVVPNGVVAPARPRDPVQVRRAWRVPVEARVALYAGRLTGTKRVGDLIEAMARLPRPHRWYLVIVGHGSARSELERMAVERELSERVRLLEFDPDARESFGGADLVVLPSSQEGMPNALLEAMVQGVPAAATPVGDVSTVLDDGAAGWLVPVGDITGWVSLLARLDAHPELLTEMGRRGETRVRAHFSMGQMMTGVEASLRRATAGSAEF